MFLTLVTISCSTTPKTLSNDDWIKLNTKIINHEFGYRNNSIPDAYYHRGVAKQAKGDLDGAIADFTQAIQLKPVAQIYAARGGVRFTKGDFDGAIEDFTQALQLEPNAAGGYEGRGTARFLKGDFDGGIADLTQAIQLKPGWAEAYNNRGDAKKRKGDFDGAIADFTKAIELKPDYVEARNNLELAKRTKATSQNSITPAGRQGTTNLAPPNLVTATDAIPVSAVLAGMVLIPAGSFTMGDTGDYLSFNTHKNVYVSAFYMDVNLVSLSQWRSVYLNATSQGYGFVNAGSGKAQNHPVVAVDWYDCVKWCNARSQQAGLKPVYYTDAGLTQVYMYGEVLNLYVNWGANGYRLPTEAEWEKAARGGLSGKRFPWGNTISENQANYSGNTNRYSYDLGPNGYNSIGSIGGTWPGTSPVGSFAPNGYGLFDMAGNLGEWCWDWYGGLLPYPPGSPYLGGADPRGPVGPMSFRVWRGGSWDAGAMVARCANRSFVGPICTSLDIGFRCVRGFEVKEVSSKN